MSTVFGRTNLNVADTWLRLTGDGPLDDDLCEAVLASQLPIDISSQPALWGGRLRQDARFGEALVMARSSVDFERATDEGHAVHLVHAHLIEVLSAIGRGSLDFYFVRIRRTLEEFQINGVLQALEMAREEGMIRFFGLAAEASASVVRSVWQFHDGFEALLVPAGGEATSGLVPLAKERRVGVLFEGTGGGSPRLVPVRAIADLEAWLEPAGL